MSGRIADLRALLAEATPGPWRAQHGSVYPPKPQPGSEPLPAADGSPAGWAVWPILSGENTPADAALIVAAVNALPLLLDVVDAARSLVDMGPSNRANEAYARKLRLYDALGDALDVLDAE